MNSSAFFSPRGRLARLMLVPILMVMATLGASTGAFAQTAGDPPDRVAQLNYFDGPVSFAPAGFDQWAGAVLNRPLTQGDRLWNDAGARSELHIDSTAVRLDGSTSLSFSTLDNQTVQLALTQGSLIARVRSLPSGQRFEIDTPNLAFTASQPGDYRVDVDPASGTTRVTVQSGSGVVYGSDGASAGIYAREQITFSGAGLAQVAAQTAPALDPFDRWAQARDQGEDRSISARYVSRDVIGYQQLDNYGDWENDPTYGAVWVPRVTVADWAPYRVGHWASIAPWGWTWIDDEPWGFAPFHYGRWAQRGARWCWVPGAIAVRPVYAPALVGFVGGSAGGINFNISVGGAFQPGVAWFPLAPGEAWHPSFRASPTYVTNVNRTVINHNVTNITNITNVTNVYRYQHLPAAVTAVTVAAFAQGQHVRGNARPVAVAELERARVVAPPEPTRDPRSVFGASRLTQTHPAPPAAVVDRRVVSNNPAFNRDRAGNPPAREASPGQQLRPEAPRNAQDTPPRGFTPPGPANAAAPVTPAVRPPLAGVPLVPREQREPSKPARNEAIVVPRPAAPAQPPQQAVPRQSPVQQEQVQREQAQREQALRQQNAQREQTQNEQAARAAQMQRAQESQRTQQEQQMRQVQAQRMQQEQQMQAQRAEQQTRQAQAQQAQAQRVQQEQQMRQAQAEAQAQRARPPQEQRAVQAPENRARPNPDGERQQPRRQEQRPAQVN